MIKTSPVTTSITADTVTNIFVVIYIYCSHLPSVLQIASRSVIQPRS